MAGSGRDFTMAGARLSRPLYLLLFFVTFATAVGNLGLVSVMPAIGRALAIPDALVACIFSASALAWMFTSPFWARRSDVRGRKPMLLVGLGGVFVEVFKDTALYPAPLNKTEALDMLKSLKAYMLLCGYRGSKPCDLDALADCMVQISHFAAAERDSIRELDLNPVFVYEQGQGIYIADALIVKNNEA